MHIVTRLPSRLAACAALAGALAGAACRFPTDKSDAVFVTLDAPSLVVLRGQDVSVFARAWRVIGTDTQAIANVDFMFYTGSSSIARVEKDCCGYATVTGVNSGMVDIVARAVAFEQAGQADLTLRVAAPLEVDSVRPRTVRYGDTVTVYGVGVDSIVLASLSGADLFPYPFSGTYDSASGLGTIKFWVPPPARTDTLLYVGKGVFAWSKDTTVVLPFDIYEPNEIGPTVIDLESPPAFPQLPFFRYLNPALAFEQLKRDQPFGVDWYRFDQTSTRDVTLILTAPTARGTFLTFLSDDLFYSPADTNIFIGPDAWTIGPGSHNCHGHVFEPPEAAAESTIVALRGMPAGSLHALSLYGQPARYGLTVIEGYVATLPALFPPDPREEDDYCNRVDGTSVATVPAGTFRDTLTIDNPHDVDWIRFTVGGAIAQSVRFRTASLVPAFADSSDIDLYVLTAPPGADTLVEAGRLDRVGSTEDATILLNPGRDYYAVVVDFQGVPTRYSVCIGSLAACGTAFPSPPALQPSAAVESVRGTPLRRKPPLHAPRAPRRP
ncbi:MAG: hypothetical protein ACREMC_08125 [Gemmatimonadales bacterium]